MGSQIQPLPTASTHIHPDITRTRKLLLSKRELNHLIGSVERQGYTIVPLSLYWKKNLIKIKLHWLKEKRLMIKEKR